MFLVLSKYIAVFLVSALLAERLTVFVAQVARRLGVVDRPSERRLHVGEIPRAGGIAIILSFFLIASAVTYIPGGSAFAGNLNSDWLVRIAFPASILLAVGLVDDTRGISPLQKIAGQTLAIFAAYGNGISIQSISVLILPIWLDLPLTILFLLALINAFNLIDGLDGLAAGLAAIATCGLIGLSIISSQPLNTLMMLAFLGSLLGFLRHNFHPASVFLGDTGSMFLGFLIGMLALESSMNTSVVTSLAIALLAFGVPLIDTILAVWRRSMRRLLTGRGKVSQADMDHLHHRLIRVGLSQRKVAYILYLFSAGLVVVGLTSVLYQSQALGIYLIAFSLGAFIVIRHFVHVELWDTGRVIVRGLSLPPSSFFATALYPVLDVLILVISFVMASLLITEHSAAALKQTLLQTGPLWCGIAFIALALSKSYARVWSRARTTDYVYLLGGLFVGVVFASGLDNLFNTGSSSAGLTFSVLFLGFAAAGITGLRALPRIAQDIMAFSGQSSVDRHHQRRVLIIGKNLFFLRHLKRSVGDVPFESTINIVGFIDRDRNLRHRLIFGYPVLGTFPELDSVLDKEAIDEILLSEPLSEAEMHHVIFEAGTRGVTVRRWELVESIILDRAMNRNINAVQSNATEGVRDVAANVQ
jgi:UDP-N-acetylmuramyl pentapeptide phosphotransferase/UDP-N-acetylglucosamine-1-phosphate transferase